MSPTALPSGWTQLEGRYSSVLGRPRYHKYYARADEYSPLLQGLVDPMADGKWSASVFEDNDSALGLGYRDNFTTCALARMWCDLRVAEWERAMSLGEDKIRFEWALTETA